VGISELAQPKKPTSIAEMIELAALAGERDD
jgi:hypothetical protein